MRRALAALTILTAHAANMASELEAFVDAAAAPAPTAQTAQASDRVVFVKTAIMWARIPGGRAGTVSVCPCV